MQNFFILIFYLKKLINKNIALIVLFIILSYKEKPKLSLENCNNPITFNDSFVGH